MSHGRADDASVQTKELAESGSAPFYRVITVMFSIIMIILVGYEYNDTLLVRVYTAKNIAKQHNYLYDTGSPEWNTGTRTVVLNSTRATPLPVAPPPTASPHSNKPHSLTATSIILELY